jgi:hypothetical protein
MAATKANQRKTRETGTVMLEALVASQQSTELMEMARHFFSLMGGPMGFARELHAEYRASKAGGMVRYKILDLVLQCQRFITPKDALKEELGLLTEGDLERVHQEALKAYAKTTGTAENLHPAGTRGAGGEGGARRHSATEPTPGSDAGDTGLDDHRGGDAGAEEAAETEL